MSGRADILYLNGSSSVPLLPKPFRLDQLRQRVAEVLSATNFDPEPGDAKKKLLAISE